MKEPRIERVGEGFSSAESDAPEILHAELLPSGELLLEPKQAGVVHVFVFADRLVRVIEVAAGAPLPAPDPPPAKPCAKPPINAACYPAWRTFLQHLDAKNAPPLELEMDGLQEEVRAADALLAKAGLTKISLSASPFGLKIKGAADAAEERRAILVIWPALLGPLRLDR